MTWLWRGHDDTPPPPPSPDDAERDDTPDALRRRQWALVQFINSNAGHLPVEAVVLARRITDAIRAVIDMADDPVGGRPLDIYTIVSINGIVDDYVPTTLRAYLALDPRLTEQVGPSGRTPRAALRDQLEALGAAAADVLAAARSHDVDAIFTQGNFLRTKFSRSDLDL